MEPEGLDACVGNFNQLESHTWQITHGVAGSSESGDEHLVVLVAELHATILWHVGSDSLVVLFELHSHALTHGGVGLLGLNTNLVDNDASGVGGAGEGLLPLGNLMR